MKHASIERNEQAKDIKTMKGKDKPLQLPEFTLADGIINDKLEKG